MPVLRNWWTCYDETGEVTPTGPDLTSDTVGRLGTAAWELPPAVPLVQAGGIQGGLLTCCACRPRSEERVNSRHGYRTQEWDTRRLAGWSGAA
jgi:hypothetical protein